MGTLMSEPSDPEADAEDVPRVDGVYVAGTSGPARESECPDCGAPIEWDLQDTHEVGGERFSERLQVCGNTCGWAGRVAWFPWRWMKDAYVVKS